MTTYNISVEGMVQRTITVQAQDQDEANTLAKEEFVSLVGAHRGYLEGECIAMLWTVEDIHGLRPDLTDEQAMNVLITTSENHDANVGVNWDVLHHWATDLYGKEIELEEKA